MDSEWWKEFFDRDYLALWAHFNPPEKSEQETDGLWEVLGLGPGSRVLDAPCGYGRHALRLARRGARVLGVDQSEVQLERARGKASEEPGLDVRFLCHDLRHPIAGEEGVFDAAINLFSSLGYGSESDDLAILQTLRRAVRPGGWVFVETNQRDAVVAFLARNARPAAHLPDGTLIVEEPRLDPLRGRVETRWYWAGPAGQGVKEASFRTYTPTELVALLLRAGLEFVSAHQGCSPQPFGWEPEKMGGRIGLLSRRS